MGEFAALVAAMLWAYASIQFAVVSERCSALTVNFLKCSGGLICLTLIWGFSGGWTLAVGLTAYGWFYLVLSSVVGLLLGDTFFFLTLKALEARQTLLVSAMIPPLTGVISGAWIGEGLSPMGWVGLVVTGAGVSMVVLTDRGDRPAQARRLGLIWGGFLVVTTALGNVMVKVGGAGLDGLPIAVIRLAVVVPLLAVALLAMGQLAQVRRPWQKPRTARPLILGTVSGTVFAIWFLMHSFAHANVAVATALAGTTPIWVLPLSWWLERDRPSAKAVLGALVAVGGIVVLALG